MIVIELNTILKLSAVPRIAPFFSDSLVLTAIKESNQESIAIELIHYMHNGRLIFTFDTPETFKSGDKLEISIKNETENTIVYRGKAIVVKENTDIQNYTPSKQTIQRFKTKTD